MLQTSQRTLEVDGEGEVGGATDGGGPCLFKAFSIDLATLRSSLNLRSALRFCSFDVTLSVEVDLTSGSASGSGVMGGVSAAGA